MNLAQWIGSSITRRIAAATVLLTMSLVVVLGVISYQNMRTYIRGTIDATLRDDADHIALHIERLLDAMNENAAGLAENSIIANALHDPEGRSRYLVPFFLSYQLPEQVPFTIALCDPRGEVLAGSAQNSSFPLFRNKTLLEQVIRRGSPYAAMLPDKQQNILLIAHPVQPPASTRPQGMLVLEVLLDDVFDRAWRSEGARRNMNVSLQCCDDTIWERSTFNAKDPVTYGRPLHHLQPPLDVLKLAITVSEPADTAFLPLVRLTSHSVLAGIFALLLTLVLARLLAGRISRPLRSLTETANTVTKSGSLAVTIGPHGPDEVGSLGKAFGTMLSRLREATEGLEQRVQERTKDLEHAYEDLQAEKTFSDSVIDTLPGVFYVYDEQGHLLRWNKNNERVSGYSADELSRIHMSRLVPPEEREQLAANMREVFSKGYASTEVSILSKTGKRTPYLVTGIRAEIGGRSLLIGTGIDISERKIAEEEYRTILRTAMDGFLMMDLQGNIIDVNDSICRLLGYQRDELLTMCVWDLEAKESPEEIRQRIERLLRDGSARFESSMRRRDGRIVDLEVSINHSPDKGGRLMAFLRDITERTQAHEALRESEEKYRALIESTSDWIWEIDGNGIYIYASPKITDILGYEPAEVLGKTPFDLMPAKEAARLRPQVMATIAARGIFQRIENIALHKDGRHIILETSGVPIFDESGQWQGYRGIDRDVTARKEAEVRLISSEERFRAIFERSGTGITVITMDRKILQVNAAFASFLGYTEDELRGMNVADISYPDDDALNLDQYRGMLQGRYDHFHMEKRYYRKDGSIVWGLLTVTLIHGADGRTEFIVGMTEDITGRKQAEQALADMNRTLQERIDAEVAKNREKDRLMMVQSRQAAMGEMLGNIAHQWRQPLNIMGLIIQDIHDAQAHGQLTPDYLEKSVRRGMDVIQHMSQTIDDFRGFYRRDKEQQTFILNEVVDRALSFIEEGFHNNHIAIDVKMPEAVAATGYPNEFAQVLLNILNNAKDVLLDRRVLSPKLAIRVFSDQGRSVVTIADNAGGIMAEDLDRVFDPFFTTKEEGQGTGIGLYMSKIIIEQNMSGRLTARNITEGAEFRIEV